MTKATRLRKAFVFMLTGGGAYVALFVLGHGEQALQTLKTGVEQQLQLLLSAAVGGVFALLLPTNPKKDPGNPPSSPKENASAAGVEPVTPLWDSQTLFEKVREWEAYGDHIEKYVEHQKKARLILDVKQTVLRTSLFGIIGLGLLLCVFGFWAPTIVSGADERLQETEFLKHLTYLLTAFAIAGFIIGAVIHRVRIHTLSKHAFRCALMSASVLSVSSFLLSLPYVFVRMRIQEISIGPWPLPMLVWMAGFRVIIGPLTCAIFGYVGFWLAHFFSRPTQVSSSHQ